MNKRALELIEELSYWWVMSIWRVAGVTLNSDPIEKWLPGSFFNVKSDSPGHFSMLKADTVQILTSNFGTTGRKKVTPPMKFWLPGGVIFQRFLHIENKFRIPPPTKLWRFTGFTIAVCLSVHLSVRLWKSGFCTITPFPYDIQWWYFTYILTLTWGGPLFILGQKVKGEIWTLNFFTVSAPQLHLVLAYNNDTSQIYRPRPEKDLYWFWGQRIKDKVIFGI